MIDTKFLDGTRIILALWVVFDHFYAYIGGMSFYKIPYGQYLLAGEVPVNGFITITGFLMMYHYILRSDKEPYIEKNTMVKFWLRRIFRLYPVYFFIIVIAFLLADYRNSSFIHVKEYLTSKPFNPAYLGALPDIYDLVSHITFTHGLFPTHVLSILVPAWSLSLEMQFYLLFPLIVVVVFMKPKRIFSILLIAVFVSELSVSLFGIYGKSGYIAQYFQPSILPYRFSLFLYGMILASVVLNKIDKKYLFVAVLFVFPSEHFLTGAVIAIITLLLFLDRLHVEGIIQNRSYKILNKFRQLLSSNIANFGANISYSVYLIHWFLVPFSIELSMYFFKDTNGIYEVTFYGLLIYLLLTLTISTALYYTIEKPFISLGKSFIKNNLSKTKTKVTEKTA